MPLLKYYDAATSQWLPILAGAKGDTGETGPAGPTGPAGLGSVAVTAPITNAGTSTAAVIGIDLSSVNSQIEQRPISHNYVLNSAFDIWQRGTTFTYGATAYTADRWRAGRTASVAGGQTNRSPLVPTGFDYSTFIQRTSGNTSTNGLILSQPFESVGKNLRGKTVTLSFYALRGTDYSATGNVLEFGFNSSSAAPQDASYATGGLLLSSSPDIASNSADAVLTTSWQRFSATFTIPTTADTFLIYFRHNPTGTAGTNDFARITGVQLEEGSVATPFKKNSGNIQAELAACQRYYVRYSYANNNFIGVAVGHSTNQFAIQWHFPTEMRVAPTFESITGGIFLYPNAGTFYNFGAGSMGAIITDNKTALLTGNGANITYPDNRASLAYALSTRTFAFRAEL